MAGFIHSLFVKVMRHSFGPDPIQQAIKNNTVLRDEPSQKQLDSGLQATKFKDYPIYTYGEPVDGEPIVYYTHGGGFVMGMCSLHFQSMAKFSELLQHPLICPDFPLPPETDAHGTIGYTIDHLKHTLETYPNSPFVLTGDSAGGHMSIAIIQGLPAKLREQIKAVFPLFSFLDCRRKASTYVLHKEEAFLKPEPMQKATDRWVGKFSAEDPIVSPILGDLSVLPPVHIYSGDKDPLHVDSLDLETKLKEIEHPHTHRVFEGYGHDFIFFPTPDAKKALNEIAQTIRSAF